MPAASARESVRVREQAVLHMQEGEGLHHILEDQTLGDSRCLPLQKHQRLTKVHCKPGVGEERDCLEVREDPNVHRE